MRRIFYAVANKDTKEKITVGCNSQRAEETLAEMQKKNPNGNYAIVYKWGNI